MRLKNISRHHDGGKVGEREKDEMKKKETSTAWSNHYAIRRRTGDDFDMEKERRGFLTKILRTCSS